MENETLRSVRALNEAISLPESDGNSSEFLRALLRSRLMAVIPGLFALACKLGYRDEFVARLVAELGHQELPDLRIVAHTIHVLGLHEDDEVNQLFTFETSVISERDMLARTIDTCKSVLERGEGDESVNATH